MMNILEKGAVWVLFVFLFIFLHKKQKKLFVCLQSFFNRRQYCKNSLLSSCYITVIYLLFNIANFSVINLISYVSINSVFVMLTREL